jgi:hypothetical protein
MPCPSEAKRLVGSGVQACLFAESSGVEGSPRAGDLSERCNLLRGDETLIIRHAACFKSDVPLRLSDYEIRE